MSAANLAADNDRLRDALRFALAANERQAATIAELRENLPRLLAIEAAARAVILAGLEGANAELVALGRLSLALDGDA